MRTPEEIIADEEAAWGALADLGKRRDAIDRHIEKWNSRLVDLYRERKQLEESKADVTAPGSAG